VGLLAGERRRQRSQPRPWYVTVIGVFSALATIGLLVVVVEHREAQLPRSSDCPPAATVNRELGTAVASASAVSENDLLGCFYAQGSDGQAVSVTFAIPGVGDRDPCRGRRQLRVSGHQGCDVSGTRGTSRTGRSLLVEVHLLQYQFSSDRKAVTLSQLEDLASRTLALAPPPVESVEGQ
jgi:hypothetical protein